MLGEVEGDDDRERGLAETTTPEMLRKRTVQACAGCVAQCLPANRHVREAYSAAADDYDRIDQLALWATRSIAADAKAHVAAADAYIREREREAWTLVSANRAAIVALAHILFAEVNDRVPGDRLQRLLADEEHREGSVTS